MRTAAVLPVKRYARAKQRLGATVGDPLRARLAHAMAKDVLGALSASAAVELTIVVSADEQAAGIATASGALVLDDTPEDGQSGAVARGIGRALAAGFERVLCVPGDCPALDPAELDALLGEDPGGPSVVIVPDRHGTGTNALVLAPPDVIAPAFGPGSFARHRLLAQRAGATIAARQPPSLLLDIDTGADLSVLRRRLASAPPAGSGAERPRDARPPGEGPGALPGGGEHDRAAGHTIAAHTRALLESTAVAPAA